MKSIFFFICCILVATNGYAQHNGIHFTQKISPATTIATVKMERPERKAIGAPIEVKNANANQYQIEFNKLTAQGYRPTKISVKRQQVIDYTDGEIPQIAYWVTFQKFDNDYPWVARHNLSAQAYQNEFNTWTAQGYIPISIGVGATDGDEVYGVIFDKIPNPPAFVARHGLGSADFNKQNQDLLQQGYKLKQKASCVRKGTTIYAAIWTK